MSINNSISQNSKLGGLLLFLAGAVIFMGIITGEIYYPAGYTTKNSEISDLGATRPPNSIITQPSASIFNATMVAAGIMTLLAAYFIYKANGKKFPAVTAGLLGLGILGVGIFPGNHGSVHPWFAMTAFVFGGLAAIASFWAASSPFRYVAPALGVITLATLFTAGYFIPILGDGGTERWVAYPVIIWMVGFGGYMLGSAAPAPGGDLNPEAHRDIV